MSSRKLILGTGNKFSHHNYGIMSIPAATVATIIHVHCESANGRLLRIVWQLAHRLDEEDDEDDDVACNLARSRG